ncbi:MAG TPA: 4-alpha-glucanotransferase [Rhizomicrobium sp.]|nr:4-alpha-glucanotransferase [Rhizomicrobium sp.]
MSDESLRRLARAAGLQVEWTDSEGRPLEVAPDTLRAVLRALGYPADSPKDVEDSRERIDEAARQLPPLITAHPHGVVPLGSVGRARLQLEDGSWRGLPLVPRETGGAGIQAPDSIGYHRLELDDSTHILAVAPPRCYGIGDVAPGRRLAGIAVQIYSLCGGHSEGFGDFAALAEFAHEAGDLGVDAIAVSPTHARFASRPESISPYAPSSRLFLDPLYADVALVGLPKSADRCSAELIDWPEAHRRKYARLRDAFRAFEESGQGIEDFRAFRAQGGQRLLNHILYEALAAHFETEGKRTPSEWPEGFRDCATPEVKAFAKYEEKEIEYQVFLQWLATRSAAAAQARARQTMAVGVISDLAVGVDPTGSHAWSAPDELIGSLSLGAPPDTFNPAGQNWGLTTFSPTELRRSGYDGFIAMLRATMQYAGGIRIDHAMGLRRMWLLPQGAGPNEGVYVSYPVQDLLRLIALESVRHKAIVVGEDLGTVPDGFRTQLSDAGILGMRVLWFEREHNGRFVAPACWEANSVGLTTTHDLHTVAGWWQGRDLDWSAKLQRKTRLGSIAAEQSEREKDRSLLWSAFQEAGCARGSEPPEAETDAVIEGALEYVGKTPCQLAIAAAEDIAGTAEQPNLPGTTDEHPNWRRRLPGNLLDNPAGRHRVARFVSARKT